MPFVLLMIGVLFLIVAIQGTQGAFFALLKSEFTGSSNFVTWVMALLILGALGYIKPIRPIADGMILLIILVMILANKGGFFSQFNQQVAHPVAPAGANASASTLQTVPALPASNPSIQIPALSDPGTSGLYSSSTGG